MQPTTLAIDDRSLHFEKRRPANNPQDQKLVYRRLVAVLRDAVTALTYRNAKARVFEGAADDDDYLVLAELELEWDRDAERTGTVSGAIGAVTLQAPGYVALFVLGFLVITVRRWLPKRVRPGCEPGGPFGSADQASARVDPG